MMEVVPFITGARCQVMSQLMIDYWAISEQGWADGAVHCLRFFKDGNHHFKSVNMGNCMHCRAFLCISSIRRHQEVCPCNPEYQHKIQGHLRQQKRLQKYTPSQNDVILQSNLQRRNKESYPELNGNVILEDLIRTHSASYKMARQGSKERTEVADKTMKTTGEIGYFVRYYESKIVKYEPISTRIIRAEISKMLNNLGYYIE